MRTFRVTVDGTAYTVSVEEIDGDQAAVPHAAQPCAPHPAARPSTPPTTLAPAARPVTPPTMASKGANQGASQGAGDIPSPLAGVIATIDVAVGDTVAMGDVLLSLEAMKMRAPLTAPQAGRVVAIHVAPGQSVLEGQALLTLS